MTRSQTYNDFEHLSNFRHVNGYWPHAMKIYCSSCTNSQVIQIAGGKHTLNQPNAEASFRAKGWRIGRRRKYDICPTCIEAAQKQSEERRSKAVAKPVTAYVTDIPEPPFIEPPKDRPMKLAELEKLNPASALKPKAEPPELPTRADKRIIADKLNEVYVDETTGYSASWTDQLVARVLGVPVKWVADVREDMFGPEKTNDNIRETLKQAKELLANATSQRELLNTLAKQGMEARDKIGLEIADLTKRIDNIERALK